MTSACNKTPDAASEAQQGNGPPSSQEKQTFASEAGEHKTEKAVADSAPSTTALGGFPVSVGKEGLAPSLASPLLTAVKLREDSATKSAASSVSQQLPRRAPTSGGAGEKGFVSKGVQASPPASSAAALGPCLKHPPLRCFAHLPPYERFEIPDDSFAEKSSRGKAVGGGAFQKFIQDYSPPPYQAVDRHMKQMLDRQINFITHCRPHSLAMGGTIRWLKKRLSRCSALQLEETRSRLSGDIQHFISGRLINATWTAASILEQQLLEEGDRLMVFGRSSAVNCALTQAKRQGLTFSVVVVDAQHSTTGQRSAREFSAAGIHVTYTLLNGLSYHIREVSKVVLGCASLLANGYVLNSAGAAAVAMMGKMHAKPVFVITETYKMSDRVLLDSCCFNELNNPALVWPQPSSQEGSQQQQNRGASASSHASRLPRQGGAGSGKQTTAAASAPSCTNAGTTTSLVSGSRLRLSLEANSASLGVSMEQAEFGLGPQTGGGDRHPNCRFCQSLNAVPVVSPTYDVTPCQFIDYVVTEDGIIPAANVPAFICGSKKSPGLED